MQNTVGEGKNQEIHIMSHSSLVYTPTVAKLYVLPKENIDYINQKI